MTISGKVVLAVDDNEAHVYALCRALKHAGLQTVTAVSGSQALECAKNHPHIILLDVNLPDVNGFEVCRRLKADPETMRIPVIFISATSQSQDAVDMGKQAGAESFLFYPVEMSQLLAVMEGAFTKSATNGA